MTRLPQQLQAPMAKARRLEWWTLGLQALIVGMMALVLGSSQTMKSAWVEDILGLVPAIIFLVAVRFESKVPTRKFPFGFTRVNSLAFAAAAATLLLMAAYLIFDSASKLIAMEHPTIGTMELFGQTVWMGWVMIGALVISVIPPIILGRLKQPVAETLQDKVLHTDALMQKADWMTGLAGIAGIAGVGFGLWWADSLAALLIAFDIAHDGITAARIAAAELIDGMPRKLGSPEVAEDAKAIAEALRQQFPEADVRLRETGRYIAAEVAGAGAPEGYAGAHSYWQGEAGRAWRLASIAFNPETKGH